MPKKVTGKQMSFIVLPVLFGIITLAIIVFSIFNMNKKDDVLKGSSNPSSNSSVTTVSNISNQSSSEQSSSVSGSSSSLESSSEPETVPAIKPVQKYDKPTEMKAAVLNPGTDFLLKDGMSDTEVLAEIDTALKHMTDLKLNTVIVNTKIKDKVIYKTSLLPTVCKETDYLQTIIKKAKEKGFFIYITYNVLDLNSDGTMKVPDVVDADAINKVEAIIKEISSNYEINGILLDNYYNPQKAKSYEMYSTIGAGIGFDKFMYETSELVMKTISNTVLEINPAIQLGILTDSVWANSTTNESGSKTNDTLQTYYDTYTDAKYYIESKLFDFVAVKAYGATTDKNIPFANVVSWWANIANTSSVPMYVFMAADKACSDAAGWIGPDQLTRQVIEARKHKGFAGSVFNSLAHLVKDPDRSTSTLVKYYNNEIQSDGILRELSITTPKQNKFTTYEPKITFSGASDPNFDVLFNGQKITTNAKGYFSVYLDLKPGNNVFTITHKGRTNTYEIYRRVVVLKDVDPKGTITVDGETNISISAVAYKGSSVYAVVNGKTVTLSPVDSSDDSTIKDSNYQRYEGVYKAPKSTKKEQVLGAITIHGNWQGMKESKKGAMVKVNKILDLSETQQVVVVADRAETFPFDTTSDFSSPVCYPLPKGTTDFVIGNKMTVVENGETFYYYKLKSGKRVYCDDVRLVSQGDFKNNAVNAVEASSDGRFTYIKFKMDWNVPFSMELAPVSFSRDFNVSSYSPTSFSITFDYTSSYKGSAPSLSSSPLFDGCSISSSTYGDVDRITYTFSLSKRGGYYGHYAYYDDSGNLTIRFNNPVSLSNARIFIDSGHGGRDPGAMGYANISEASLNWELAQRVKSRLESYGATVYMPDTYSNGYSMKERVNMAREWKPHLYLSLHHNSAADPSVSGVEGYYFTPFSMSVTKEIVDYLADYYANDIYRDGSSKYNRKAKFGRYFVTREYDFMSCLIECGFVTNPDEMMYLIDPTHKEGMADAIVRGIRNYFN